MTARSTKRAVSTPSTVLSMSPEVVGEVGWNGMGGGVKGQGECGGIGCGGGTLTEKICRGNVCSNRPFALCLH